MAVSRRVAYVHALAARLADQIADAKRDGLNIDGPFISRDTRQSGAWNGFKVAWAQAPADATHRVILQDDVAICADLPHTLWQLALIRPTQFISGFLPRELCQHAMAQGLHWAATTNFAWAQCLLIPVPMGDLAMRWIAAHERGRPWRRSNDRRLKDFLRATKRRAYVPVPHPVDHISQELGGSTIGHKFLLGLERAKPGTWLGEDVKLADRPWHDLRVLADP